MGKKLEKVDRFTYFREISSSNGNLKEKINSRLGKDREVMRRLKSIWKNNGISIKTKNRMTKSMAQSIATYGCESWTAKKKTSKKLEGFEMFSLRTTQRICWEAKRTNEEVLKNGSKTTDHRTIVHGMIVHRTIDHRGRSTIRRSTTLSIFRLPVLLLL